MSDQLGGQTTRPIASDMAFSMPAANILAEHRRPFSFGNRLFNTNWTDAPGSVKSFDGLGPLFNRVSCSGCHTRDGRGRPPETQKGPMDSMLIRLSIPGVDANGGPNPHPAYGDQLSERAIGGVEPEGQVKIAYETVIGTYGDGVTYQLRKPLYQIESTAYGVIGPETMISPRVAPQVFGLGLLQAVPEETLMALADPQDSDGDGISGRLNMVWDSERKIRVAGRFGWKANQPNLRQQNAGAARGDIGLTTSLAPDQNCSAVQQKCIEAVSGGSPELSDEFLHKLTLYTMTLAVPAQRNATNPDIRHGAELFREMGCASCHMPTLQTGTLKEVPEVSGQTFHPFTDLLLHDLGAGLSDGRPDFEAGPSEWRTPPLWGLGLISRVNGHELLLHDGRARGMAEAILWHGGEAEQARESFRLAPKPDRDALIAFLKSL